MTNERSFVTIVEWEHVLEERLIYSFSFFGCRWGRSGQFCALTAWTSSTGAKWYRRGEPRFWPSKCFEALKDDRLVKNVRTSCANALKCGWFRRNHALKLVRNDETHKTNPVNNRESESRYTIPFTVNKTSSFQEVPQDTIDKKQVVAVGMYKSGLLFIQWWIKTGNFVWTGFHPKFAEALLPGNADPLNSGLGPWLPLLYRVEDLQLLRARSYESAFEQAD